MTARRINMTKVPFNYHWAGVRAVTVVRELGEVLVKDEIADAAIAAGYATEMPKATKEGEATKRAPKPKKATAAKKAAIPASDATDPGEPAGLDRADLAHDDSADGGAPVADAG